MDNGTGSGGGYAHCALHRPGSIFCLPDDQQMNCVLEKGWSPQSSGCYRLRMQGGKAHVWEMHNAKMGFQSGYPRNIQLGHMVRFLIGFVLDACC